MVTLFTVLASHLAPSLALPFSIPNPLTAGLRNLRSQRTYRDGAQPSHSPTSSSRLGFATTPSKAQLGFVDSALSPTATASATDTTTPEIRAIPPPPTVVVALPPDAARALEEWGMPVSLAAFV